MDHPYRSFSDRQFWDRAVANNYTPSSLLTNDRFLILKHDKVVSAGSCFAANLVPYLEAAGLHYLRTEAVNPFYKSIPPERLSYAKFSAAYGNIYTARQLLQLLRRATGVFEPEERVWKVQNGFVDPFRPGLAYISRSLEEFEVLSQQHLRAVLSAFSGADVFIFTLGLTEAWLSHADGAVFPACPGTLAGSYDPARHRFHNFTVDEISNDLITFCDEISRLNAKIKIIITVSPVPLVATAESGHVLCSTMYSKSVLRVAAEAAARSFDFVTYFPSYEIVTGPQAPWEYFEADRRTVSQIAITHVMNAFLSQCEVANGAVQEEPMLSENSSTISRILVDIECEEAAQSL